MSRLLAGLRPADTLTVGFSFFLLVLTVFFYAEIPSAGNLILIYSSLIFFQLVILRIGRLNAFLGVTRDIVFPVVAVLIIFDSLGLIVHSINPQDLDYLLIRLDYLILGGYPTILMERFANPMATDVLQIAYTTYYFQAVALGAAVRVRCTKEEFEKTVFFLLLCYYLSYVGYLLVPALGPRYTLQHLQATDLGGFLVADSIQNVLNLLEGVKRDAFPSGHTGVALTVLFLAYRYTRGLFWLLLIPVVLLVVGTVYCRYHYVVDVIAGVLLAVVTVGVGEVYYRLRMKENGHPLHEG